jgi:hypothetical protein
VTKLRNRSNVAGVRGREAVLWWLNAQRIQGRAGAEQTSWSSYACNTSCVLVGKGVTLFTFPWSIDLEVLSKEKPWAASDFIPSIRAFYKVPEVRAPGQGGSPPSKVHKSDSSWPQSRAELCSLAQHTWEDKWAKAREKWLIPVEIWNEWWKCKLPVPDG